MSAEGPGRESPGDWWDSYFDEDFVELYSPFLTDEVTRQETAAVIEALGLAAGARILDLGCGWGRHSHELAAAGYDAVGLDRSHQLLRRAASTSAPGASWVRGDVRDLPFRAAFDAVVSLFSSLGYFLDDAIELAVLQGIAATLRPGGVFLLETMHRDLLAREFADRDWWTLDDGTMVWMEREFDAVAGVSHEILRWQRSDGSLVEKRHSIRVRSATEWSDLLIRAGFEPLEWFGSWDLEPFTHTSERLMVLSEVQP